MRLSVLAILFCLVSGCSIKIDEMVPEKVAFGANYQSTVGLHVYGSGRGSTPVSNKIGFSDLETAVRRSIEKSGLFKQIVSRDSADYVLSARLTQSDSSVWGLELNASVPR